MVIVGSVVGSGVFVVSAYAAKNVASPGALFAVWALGGLITLCGAVCVAELGALFPRGGGDYVYVKEAFGPAPAFLSGWTSFCVVFPGSIAAMGAAFGNAAALLSNVSAVRPEIIGTAAIAALTVVNCLGLRPGKWTQNTLSVAKLLAFLAVLVVGVASDAGSASHFRPLWGDESATGLALALVPITFAYSGWNAAAYVAGEIHDPTRNLSRALLWGTAVCAVLYLAVNAVYLYALPIAELREAKDVARAAASRLFGGAGANVVSALVVVVVGSALQANILTGARIYQAMAQDGLFFRALCAIHPRSHVPVRALVAQGALSIVLLWSGRFDQLLEFTTTPLLLFAGLTVVAVVVLRRRRPTLERVYRTPLYPLPAIVFVASTLWVLGSVLASGAVEAIYGLAIVAAGVPLYLLLWRTTAPRPT
jgi:APA family basic amino acid/polyamine antiporter